jgi:multisubunit Na+/H+ antiporter MnhG subunit
VTPWSVTILLALAVLSEVVCVVGVFRAANTFARLHFSGATSAVAPFLVLAAMVVEQRDHNPTWNAAVDALALFVLNSTLTHATARIVRQREHGDLEL